MRVPRFGNFSTFAHSHSSHSRIVIPILISVPKLYIVHAFPFPLDSHGKNGKREFPLPMNTSNIAILFPLSIAIVIAILYASIANNPEGVNVWEAEAKRPAKPYRVMRVCRAKDIRKTAGCRVPETVQTALVNQAFMQIKNTSEFITLSWTIKFSQFRNTPSLRKFSAITSMDEYCYKFYTICLFS